MPKVRQTCTRCSMRRQKCDRKDPCTRCVQSNEAESCSRTWHDGYNPRIHRAYPRPSTIHRSSRSIATVSLSERPRRNIKGQNADEAEAQSIHELAGPDTIPDNVEGIEPGASRPIGNLQALMRPLSQVQKLLEYHESHLLWYHDCIHFPTLRQEVARAVQPSGEIEIEHLEPKWCALLFAVMATSLACTDDSTAQSWGISKARKRSMGKCYHRAAVECLQLGNYMAEIHILSVQTIIILNMSAHTHGYSSEQFIMFGISYRIAQCLGLQRLAYDAELDALPPCSEARRELFVKREIGRRIWIRLCIQDWLSIPNTGMYLLHERQCSTVHPHRIDNEDLMPVEAGVPFAFDLGTYLYNIGRLLTRFHDAMIDVTDEDAGYEQVLRYDARLRVLEVPRNFIAATEQQAAAWPRWMGWLRMVAAVVHAHKVMTIHRGFLGKSFTDARFAYTRWASITAAKSILVEIHVASADVEMPMVWNNQAHMIGASITLCLDIIHRSEDEAEFKEHRELLELATSHLRRHDENSLAIRGNRIITGLLKEAATRHRGLVPAVRTAEMSKGSSIVDEPLAWPLEGKQAIDAIRASEQQSGDDTGSTCNVNASALLIPAPTPADDLDFLNDKNNNFIFGDDYGMPSDVPGTDLLSDYFLLQGGIDNAFSFQDMWN